MNTRFLRYFFAISCIQAFCAPIYAQKEPVDSIELSSAGKNAQYDELFFNALKSKMREDYKQATDLFEQYVAVRPDVSAGYYELSKLYYNFKNLDRATKNLDKAEADIKKAIELDKGNKWYKEQYASILADKGSDYEAGKIMAQLSDEHPEDRTYPLMAAEYFERAHKYDDAIRFLDKANTQEGGVDEDIQMRKMQLYLDLNNVDKAADAVNTLIAHDPRNGKYYKLLGDIYDNNKMPDKASEVYRKAGADMPGDPYVQLGIAEHALKKGDTASYKANVKKAIVNKDLDAESQLEILGTFFQTLPGDTTLVTVVLPLMKQLVVQHPGDADVIAFYGELLSRANQRDSSVEAYKKSLEIKPSNFNVWVRLLESYSEKGYADSLVKYSEKAMRLFPNQAIASYYNGIGHMNRKEYPAAIKAINRAIDMQPETDVQTLSLMYGLLADVYNMNKQYALSDKAYDKVLEMDSTNATALNNYSYYLSERGENLDKAEWMSRRSLELRPGEATFMDTYGWICYRKGDYTKAREYVQKAIDKAGAAADATLYDHLGNIYFKLNETDKAVEAWKKSKEMGGDDPELDKKIRERKLYE